MHWLTFIHRESSTDHCASNNVPQLQQACLISGTESCVWSRQWTLRACMVTLCTEMCKQSCWASWPNKHSRSYRPCKHCSLLVDTLPTRASMIHFAKSRTPPQLWAFWQLNGIFRVSQDLLTKTVCLLNWLVELTNLPVIWIVFSASPVSAPSLMYCKENEICQ